MVAHQPTGARGKLAIPKLTDCNVRRNPMLPMEICHRNNWYPP